MNDRPLVDKFLKTRSERAFTTLYRAKTPRLYQVALRLTAHDQHRAEELIQEMWIIAVKKLAGFEWRSELMTWLTGILINLSRREKKQNAGELAAQETWQGDWVEEDEEPAFTTDDLEIAMDQLSPGYRRVVILHDIEGYRHKEIAAMLDLNEGTSKSQLHHARKVLRQYLIKGKDKNTRP
ncbi:MAG TPA: RNA polymerase sigma factor [Eudoraea sp.]|nr:RNA polymerase sigma factor [Eudoraea sp.]